MTKDLGVGNHRFREIDLPIINYFEKIILNMVIIGAYLDYYFAV
jgi:hypothetical protein